MWLEGTEDAQHWLPPQERKLNGVRGLDFVVQVPHGQRCRAWSTAAQLLSAQPGPVQDSLLHTVSAPRCCCCAADMPSLAMQPLLWCKLRAVATLPRFAPVALKWASELLKGSDQVRHGVDLFGRDAMVLGRLLVTLVSQRPCQPACYRHSAPPCMQARGLGWPLHAVCRL